MSIANSQLSSKSKTQSVYQTNGKPLSPEALYKAKLKYGIYNNPTTSSIGVTSSNLASDTAALLATSTDLSIEPYKRTVATDAQTAALFARDDTAPKRWTKDYIDNDAASAAINAKSLKHEIRAASNNNNEFASSNAAAASVLSKGSKSIASSNLSSLYEFDAVRNGSKNSHNTFNIANLSKASKERANTMINDRINPQRDASRLGLETKKEDSNLDKFAAVGALASQNVKPVEDPNLEAKNIYKNSLVDPKVLAMARLNADKTLTGIDKYLGEKDMFFNPEFNAKAIELAKQKYEKRSHHEGKIDLGGGLFMSQQELDAIASKIVNPVIEDINIKAKAQRERDAEIAKKREEQIAAERKFKIEQQSKKLEEKKLKEEAKQERKKQLELEKQKQRDAKLALEKAKKEELAQHKSILTSKQKEEELKKKKLLAEKQAEEDRIAKEESDAEKQRKLELTKAEEERDLKLAPILAKLKIETDKLAVLNEEKQAIQDITDSQIKNTENAKSLLSVSKQELIDAEESFKQLTIDIENSTNESEKLQKEAELKKIEADIAIKKSNEIEAAALLKQAEIDKEQALVENEKLELELELENEKINVLQEEKEIAETLPPTTTKEETETTKETSGEKSGPELKTKKSKTVITGTGPTELSSAFESQNPSVSSIKDQSGVITPSAGEPTTGGGELKKTFSGFSQGSIDKAESTPLESELSAEDKKKSFFKEEF